MVGSFAVLLVMEVAAYWVFSGGVEVSTLAGEGMASEVLVQAGFDVGMMRLRPVLRRSCLAMGFIAVLLVMEVAFG